MSAYWECDKRGDCCRQPAAVSMTRQEKKAIIRARPDAREMAWTPLGNNMFELKAHPCPLLGADGLCTVYDVRPYNCRRFMCLRGPGESWITGMHGQCVNLEKRLKYSNHALAFYLTNQQAAMPWADRHGWSRS